MSDRHGGTPDKPDFQVAGEYKMEYLDGRIKYPSNLG